jgi:hypothetical protein
MRRKRSIGASVSFLDTLSNAMAAVLIVAIIQMSPASSTGEGAAKGFYFVSATANESRNNTYLEMIIQQDTSLVFSEVAPIDSPYHFDHAPGHIRLLITERIPPSARVWLFLRESITEAPDSLSVALSSLMPSGASESMIEMLTRENCYRVEIPQRMLR